MIEQRSERGPVFLVGFMGCGKSAVGREISRQSDRLFIDLDEEIVRVARQSIADLIRSQGEVEFRRIESSCLSGIASRNGVVVATGGGVVLDGKNRELMSRSGVTVWIDAPFDLCWQRIEIDRTVRPLAPNRDSALLRFNERQPFYRQSDIHITIDESMTSTMIAELILDRLA